MKENNLNLRYYTFILKPGMPARISLMVCGRFEEVAGDLPLSELSDLLSPFCRLPSFSDSTSISTINKSFNIVHVYSMCLFLNYVFIMLFKISVRVICSLLKIRGTFYSTHCFRSNLHTMKYKCIKKLL